jgi:hypothetical protein
MQQGRVQLDADWNEQSDIQLHVLRRLAAAIFPNGGGSGFDLATLGSLTNDFIIGAGDRWVDGILCEVESTPVAITAITPPHNLTVAAWTVDERSFTIGQYVSATGVDTSGAPVEVDGKVTAIAYGSSTLTLDADVTPLQNATAARIRRLVTYNSQPGLAGSPLASGSLYQVYLDVWERVVTYLQDDSIREVALNGADTAARTKVVWQVRALEMQPLPVARPIKGKPVPDPITPQCLTLQALATALHPNASGVLQARAQSGVESTDSCPVASVSRYRGCENQLYRVQIHNNRPSSSTSAQPATFVWSRENGSVAFPVIKLECGDRTTRVLLGRIGRDDRFGIHIGDYVEIEDDASELSNAALPLLQVQAIDRTAMLVTLTGNIGTTTGTDPTAHPFLRLWNQKAGDPASGGLTLVNGAAQIVGDTWLDLEDGVQVRFPNGDQAAYQTGDYWLIPARVATGDVIWPTETDTDVLGVVTTYPVAKHPDGIAHHYLPLAILDLTGSAPTITACAEVAAP